MKGFGTSLARTVRVVLLTASAMMLAGCVGVDTGSDAGGSQRRPGTLTSDQRWQLKSAAGAGEHELVSTVARMSWDSPEDTTAIVEYATKLKPDNAAEIAAAARRR